MTNIYPSVKPIRHSIPLHTYLFHLLTTLYLSHLSGENPSEGTGLCHLKRQAKKVYCLLIFKNFIHIQNSNSQFSFSFVPIPRKQRDESYHTFVNIFSIFFSKTIQQLNNS